MRVGGCGLDGECRRLKNPVTVWRFFSFRRVILQLIQAPARHRLRGPFLLAGANHIKIMSDLPVCLIRIKVTNLNPQGRHYRPSVP